jgi:hypothetical protein
MLLHSDCILFRMIRLIDNGNDQFDLYYSSDESEKLEDDYDVLRKQCRFGHW